MGLQLGNSLACDAAFVTGNGIDFFAQRRGLEDIQKNFDSRVTAQVSRYNQIAAGGSDGHETQAENLRNINLELQRLQNRPQPAYKEQTDAHA